MARRGGRSPALAVAAALVVASLAGCTGDGSDGSAGSGGSGGSGSPSAQRTTPTTSPTTAYPSGAPTGTVYTDPGSTLALGQPATVSWRPRQTLLGTIRVRVDKLERTTFKKSFLDWKVDARTRTYAPYFVRATVTNVGDTRLGGVPVPLYGRSAADALVEPAVFKETFKPCHASALPRRFKPGASTAVCLVYLVPAKGALVGATFRPTQDFEPIVWTGAVTNIAAPKGRRKSS